VRALLLLLVAALLAGCDSGEEAQPAPPRELPPAAITRAELTEHLTALQRIADRNGGTRAAGTPGGDASADYVAERLGEAGWRVERQLVRFPFFELNEAELSVAGRGPRRASDFQVLSYSGAGRALGPLRRAGQGCEADELAGLAEGDVPLVDRGTCFFRVKAMNAQRQGAPALLVADRGESPRGVPSGTLGGPGIRIPVLLVSADVAAEAPEGSEVRVTVDAVSERRETENLIAETPRGTGERVVMAGGHIDSVTGGPGINDNGSGVATLIELAEAIGPRPPGARVRVAFWGAEELGLIGSRRYVRGLDESERRQIAAYLNFDMVGSPNAVPAFYGDGDRDIGELLERSAGGRLDAVGIDGSSDHAPFVDAGIPVNGIYTGANESGPGGRPRDPCYHLACDRVRNVDRRVLLRMARAAAETVEALSRRHG
jgi:Zn-dependent M28 family amino/carboxypeptidase